MLGDPGRARCRLDPALTLNMTGFSNISITTLLPAGSSCFHVSCTCQHHRCQASVHASGCDPNALQRFESEGSGVLERRHSFWGVWQYVRPLRRWIKEQRRRAHGKCVCSQGFMQGCV